jgi:DNA-binding CsgD family transcriptional regulator
MNGGGADLSARARLRAAAQEQRQERARLRGDILDLVVSGYAYEAIAEKLGLSVKTVRRATAKAIEKRQLDSGADYVHLQVLRLTKAMRVVDLNLDKGDLKAVEPLLKVIAQLDKYHALSRPAPASPPLALPRPPLALAAPPAPLRPQSISCAGMRSGAPVGPARRYCAGHAMAWPSSRAARSGQ